MSRRILGALCVALVIAVSTIGLVVADSTQQSCTDSTPVEIGGPAEFQEEYEKWLQEITPENLKLQIPNGDTLTDGLTGIWKGYDVTLYAADEGNDGGNWWMAGYAWHSYNLGQRRNNVAGRCVGAGGANSWAWTGARIEVLGTGSQLCYIDFIGWAREEMVTGYGGSANWTVIGKVYDATSGSWIGQVQIFNASRSNGGAGTSGGNYSKSCLVSLQAGHQYVLMVHTEQNVSQYGPLITYVESGDGNYHTRWDQIRLRWQ